MAMEMNKTARHSCCKLAFVVTEDWYFWSHRMPSARAAKALGYEVCVITRQGELAERIRDEGITVIPWSVSRGGIGVMTELRSVARLYAIFKAIRPQVVHNVALKPVLYGSIAAQLAGVPAIINAVTGFGFLFSSGKIVASLAGHVLLRALRVLARLPPVITICQNGDDADLIFPRGSRAGLRMIPGSGVDVRQFAPSLEPAGRPVAVFVGRMLREKGVFDLVAAAALLKQRGAALRIVLVGPIDDENPGAITTGVLRDWERQGLIEWWGKREDIAAIWREAHIAVLPSYREGLPKALLEAMASARPIVTTDVPGCREVVQDGLTGLLVPPRRPELLADALQRLATSPELRARMGRAGRDRALAHFADELIIEQITAVYAEVRQRLCTATAPGSGEWPCRQPLRTE